MSVKVNSNLIGNYVFPVNERIFNNIKNVETSGMRGLCSRDFLGRNVSDSFIFHFKYETDIDFTILYVAKKYLDDNGVLYLWNKIKSIFVAKEDGKGLSTNDYLPDGYLALADSLETQSAADRAARKAPNIYLPIKLAGAIQSVVVSINVNR